MASIVKEVIQQYSSDKTRIMDILRDVQERLGHLSDDVITEVASELKMSRISVEGTASFYHFFTNTSKGKYTVYLNDSATSYIKGFEEVAESFEKEVGCRFGHTDPNGKIGLYTTSCIGMCDQEPAALINNVVFTNLTSAKVKKLVSEMKAGKSVHEMVEKLGDGKNANESVHSEVKNNIKKEGPVFFSDFKSGEALKKALSMPSLDVIEEVKKSNLRGRGGAGFPTGMKWGFCRASEADARYVICNIDEGEPGTFKDRVLMTEKPELIFEGMAIAGYAIESKEGIVYLRGEYTYLKKHLEKVIQEMKSKKVLGQNILGSQHCFDIKIIMGAGAYICGEESALIESAEGKRGQPRNRPPFPVQIGYKGKPTIVNNPESYGCATRILFHGADWFKKLGTEQSTGVKLLSVSGDVEFPGVYEVEFGTSIQEVLKLAGAKDTQAVLVGGPSGRFVAPKDFGRKVAFEDVPTGGAFTVFNKKQDLLKIVHNYMRFFVEESCGFCVPCRAGNVLLEKKIEKILIGNGTTKDIEEIKEWGEIIKTASRCGLGQTSPNPLLTSIESFPELYNDRVRKDTDYTSQFDLRFSVDESCKAAGREPKIEEGH